MFSTHLYAYGNISANSATNSRAADHRPVPSSDDPAFRRVRTVDVGDAQNKGVDHYFTQLARTGVPPARGLICFFVFVAVIKFRLLLLPRGAA